MSDHDALLAGVLAHPDADLPRLVYADFIEEAGDAARAEFIRVQCALAAGQYEDAAEKAALELRERYLREKHAPAWLAPLKKKGEPLFTPRSHGLFRRGFVECVWMPAAWFVAKAEKLFARCPVNELRVTMTTLEEFENLLFCTHFMHLRTLEVADPKLGNDVAGAIERAAAAGELNALSLLTIRAIHINDEGMSRLFHAVPESCFLDLRIPPRDARRVPRPGFRPRGRASEHQDEE
jgi:uncharacterized protein (TIGR02996 family)